MSNTFELACGAACALTILAGVVLSAHFLQQIRDVLREMLETQRKIASRLGTR